jgi:hypothetical protein
LLRVSNQILCIFSFCACYRFHPSYLSPFDIFVYCLVNSLNCEAPYCEFSYSLRRMCGFPLRISAMVSTVVCCFNQSGFVTAAFCLVLSRSLILSCFLILDVKCVKLKLNPPSSVNERDQARYQVSALSKWERSSQARSSFIAMR